ncbi:MAG: NADH:flavin oxidoreductase/NADH oxidase [Candidatus Acidiferrum sp.]|jgi:2,4-dienoyl-CoA reductase-like NADH-dependent reductase (Old Yellow Enzyme family)
MTLFAPLRLREIEFKNRIGVSPMCQYSAKGGHPGTWHLVHLGSRAVGGAALVMTEASAVQDVGRISPTDAGMYLDAHVESWHPIVEFLREQGTVPGMQLAHAGRKASTAAPWFGGGPLSQDQGGWTPVSSTDVPFDVGHPAPRALAPADLDQVVADFQQATRRALTAGFQFVEIHAAHGYLLHQFYSPLSNDRKDDYGGSFENRIRLLLRVTQTVRETLPQALPLLVRLSATDWKERGWDLEQSIELCRRLKVLGVDLVDVSSGGILPGIKIPAGLGYQVGFAEAIRRQAGVATAAVGMITDPAQAQSIIATGQADMVFLAREMLRDPYWPRRAAAALQTKIKPPVQYERAW